MPDELWTEVRDTVPGSRDHDHLQEKEIQENNRMGKQMSSGKLEISREGFGERWEK